MSDGQAGIGKWYRMEMNVENARAMRLPRHPSTDYDKSKTTGECGIL
jgi:hypothetical protein